MTTNTWSRAHRTTASSGLSLTYPLLPLRVNETRKMRTLVKTGGSGGRGRENNCRAALKRNLLIIFSVICFDEENNSVNVHCRLL